MQNKKKKDIIENSLVNSMTYVRFKSLVFELLKKGKSTGNEQSDVLLNYSKLSEKRMKRLDKTLDISENSKQIISTINKELIFLVLMESWCGDGAQTLPVINKIATLSNKIAFKIVLRDANEALMNQFLTNGSKAIPKLLILEKQTLEVLKIWGPRPNKATRMVKEYKKKNGSLDANFKKNLQIWYNQDKGNATQKDIVTLLSSI